MARKRRKPDGEGPKRRRPKSPGDIPDRRAPEGMMPPFVAGLPGDAGQGTPLDKAHEILLHAYQEPDEQRRVRLAGEALAVCPDRADAYALLAEHARSRPGPATHRADDGQAAAALARQPQAHAAAAQ